MWFSLLAQSNIFDQFGLAKLRETIDTYLVDKGPDLAANGLAAVAILLFGLWGAKLAARVLSKVLQRAKIDETLSKFLGRIAQAVIAAVVVLAALERLGVNTTSFAAILAAAGLAIGMALQGSLGNFAAGVMIIIFRPFKVGDFVDAGGATGIVEEIHIFHTLMRTPDNIQVVVPNSAVTGGNVSNYSAKPIRRIDLVVGCGYNDDLKAVKRFLHDLVATDKRILSDPEAVVAVSEMGDHCVNFVVRPWVANADYWPVRWDLTEAIKLGFDELGFQIPFPQQDIHLHRVAEISQQLGVFPAAAQSEDGAPTATTQQETATPAVDHGPSILKLVRPRRAA